MADLRPHVVDGIEEYDNPLPRWWLYGFYLSIAFAFFYAIVYPSLWFWNGTAGWTSTAQYEATVQNAPKPAVAAAPVDLEKMASDANVVAAGKDLFKTYCAACHGDNAEGKIGPPLTPHQWKYGGDPESILTTIRNGRPGGMPVWSKVMTDDKIQTVAAYVYSLSRGQSAPADGKAKTPAPPSTPATTSDAGILR
jgi:cytochrome c oxidase cbb3-type subunit III